ncbi:class F sortase [Cryobacterium tepidiphilum]|jgi:sortase (surface protein transpeptidase)|uniref:Class F sortase n=1 Tax=Cryobacterium tepidiphilum TaxID=2486026 RepID=A0A3M8L9W2_9MICO|nr:class F sortase [Cryobacterium tepidiphilum]RNE62291.1 class F sortase [Cryobacterium tepidiphilum]
MSNNQKNRRPSRLLTLAAVLLVLGGAASVGFAYWGQMPPPRPPASAATPLATADTGIPASPTPAPTAAPTASARPATPKPAQTTGPVMDASKPTRIQIPAIDVDSDLMELGLNDDGTLEVPPFEKDSPAGWYRGSPTPGEIGPSIILGHVDTYKAGPVVFYRLGDVRPGDTVSVSRADGSTAKFTVDRVESFPKDGFPELEVYGNTDRAELRLITCGGDWDPDKHQYVDDVVVFAHLT